MGRQGRGDRPDAPRILITAASGGANFSDSHLFEKDLAGLGDECGLTITVLHLPR
ncbi:hypothetical protein ABZ845_24520 [Streptomyces sp. NPDC047022]|uniref:ISAzo13-like element transposase-related protein n=1 Tax=Streptomyces sp. NPDC047022 TaxID=3155737 RepID=UPI00341166D3